MPPPPPIQTILTPQGAEYRAVCQGMQWVDGPKPQVVAIPMGPQPLTQYWEWLPQRGETLEYGGVLLMGLGGSLSSRLTVGDVALYQACIDGVETLTPQPYECDRSLIDWLDHRLKGKTAIGIGLTCDRVICSAAEKRRLGYTHAAEIVDMESASVLADLGRKSVAVAVLRVISDDCEHNLPDINSAIGADGALQAFPLAASFLKQPIAAMRLIWGSLRGLQILERVTTELFSTGDRD